MKDIKLTIDRIEGAMAVLKSDSETVNFPLNLLPKNIKEGDILNIVIGANQKKSELEKQRAKEILNEILNN